MSIGTVPKNLERFQNREPDSPTFSSKIFFNDMPRDSDGKVGRPERSPNNV